MNTILSEVHKGECSPQLAPWPESFPRISKSEGNVYIKDICRDIQLHSVNARSLTHPVYVDHHAYLY